MRNLLLASLFGVSAGAYVVPALAGPVHFQVTVPHSRFGWLPASPLGGPVTVSLGSVPVAFVMTDVMFGSHDFIEVLVLVNGNAVFNCGLENAGGGSRPASRSEHLTSGVLIPAGSNVSVQARPYPTIPTQQVPVTLAGYVQ